ncbi:MAG: DNA-binding protein [Candidatus Bathyarchaeota archaeon]|jgi:programmed cell death protein 5|nr:DNA-binding protein [Candidatus Bathyarchaeota archaeon]
MSKDEELERLKAQRMAELQARQQQGAEQQRTAAEAEAQRQALMRKLLTPEARQRLTNIKMVRPEFGQQLELELVQLAQTGRVPLPITDDQLKRLLLQIEGQQKKRDISIRRV